MAVRRVLKFHGDWLKTIGTIADLKGCNVLISNSGHAIICDFGLAALRLEIERLSGDIPRRKGTFRWASPELLMDGRLSTATDGEYREVMC